MDALKAEKEIAMRRYLRLRQLGRALRCVEVAAALLLLTWSSARLPAAAKTSGELFLAAASALMKPRAGFLIGNVIVILLFSGKLSSSSNTSNTSSNPTTSDESWYWSSPESAAAPALAEEVMYEDKVVCIETPLRREYRRSRSEKVESQRRDTPKLRRAKSEIKPKPAAAAEMKEVAAAEEEEVAGEDAEEFRRTIEAFIAKQQKFQREESMGVVSCPLELLKQIVVKE